MKIGVENKIMKNEIKSLKAIKNNENNDKYYYLYDYVPEIINNGKFIVVGESETSMYCYYVMKRYG